MMPGPPPPDQPRDYQPPAPAPVIADPQPLSAPGQQSPEQSSWTVFKTDTGCMVSINVGCPTGEPGRPMPACDPPPSFHYDCPPGLTMKRPITVITFGDSCAIEPEPIHCPDHGACNAPRPRTVPCPRP